MTLKIRHRGELADEAGITLVGFVRGDIFNIYAHAIYAHAQRILDSNAYAHISVDTDDSLL